MNLRSFVWQNSPKSLMYLYAEFTLLRNADRKFLADEVVPSIPNSDSSNVLNIGIHYYTHKLHKQIERRGFNLFTADIDEHKIKWGAKQRHRVTDAANLVRAFPDAKFDFIMIFGVLGYGINTPKHRNETFTAIREVMSDQAILMIAWDENMSQDPVKDEYFKTLFVRNQKFLGGKRHRLPNGLCDQTGKPSFKNFDFVSKRP